MGARKDRQYWLTQAERLLATDLSVREWCSLNDVSRASMYGWLTVFADEEPDLFGGSHNIVARNRRRWLETTRRNMHSSQALAPPTSDDFLLLDLSSRPVRPLDVYGRVRITEVAGQKFRV